MLNQSTIIKLKHETIMRGLKIIDISFITILYFIVGFICSRHINAYYTTGNTNFKQTSKWILFLQVCGQLTIVAILVYIIRNIVSLVPFPFNGFRGYEHFRVKELHSGGVALGFGIFYGQTNLKEKMEYIFK
jgi:ABC-type uncharacterized transport system permease subunit